MCGTHSYADSNTAQIQRGADNGIFKRKKFFDDIRLTCKSQVKHGNRNFWCRGYYVDTVGKNKKKIEEYIRNQLKEDIASDQLRLFETTDPFTGEKYKKK